MAARSAAASTAAIEPVPAQAGPVRTCIGCRQRAAATELLRVVAVSAAHATADSPDLGGASAVLVVPDPRRRAPGRGAWLHRDLRCVALAERRRAFARALRVSGVLDPTPVRDYLAQRTTEDEKVRSRNQVINADTGARGGSNRLARESELTSNEHTMKRQR